MGFLGVVNLPSEFRQLGLKLGDRVGLVDVSADSAVCTLEDQLHQTWIALKGTLVELLNQEIASLDAIVLTIQEPAKLRRE
jgi:hypothetical protein